MAPAYFIIFSCRDAISTFDASEHDAVDNYISGIIVCIFAIELDARLKTMREA
jgi:hypothetical protein